MKGVFRVKGIRNTLGFIGLTLALLCASAAQAGVTGRIAGTVIDGSTNEPIVGASVSIVGTELGGVTDFEGKYFILRVEVGAHEMKISSVGFATLSVKNIVVSTDKTTNYDASLQMATTKLEGVTVTAERPLVERGRDLSVSTVTAAEIKNLPTRGYEQVVQLQTGVVTFRQSSGNRARGGREGTNSPELNIRGGRPSSVAYLVDGFSQQDPLSGLSTTSINNNAIEEVSIITGGFPAEYGFVSAAIINTITKSGGENYSGSAEIVTDNVLGDKGFNQNIGALSFGGPVPFFENATFYVSGERNYFGDRSPSPITGEAINGIVNLRGDKQLPNNSQNGWTFQGKTKIKLSSNLSLQIGGNASRDRWQRYSHAQLFNSAHNRRYDDQNFGFHTRLTHTLSPSTFYTLAGAYFRTERETGDGVFWNDLASYTNDVFTGDPTSGNVDLNLFYNPGSTVGGYLRRISTYKQGKGDITSRTKSGHLFKAGFDVQQHVLRRFNHIIPFNVASKTDSAAQWQDANYYGFNGKGVEGDFGGRDAAKKPISISLYVQDKYDWNGMILTAGIRYDYFDYKTKQFVDPNNPLGTTGDNTLDAVDLVDAKTISDFSPRLGVAFPLDEITSMHFSFGKFFKRPDLDKLYTGFNYFEYKTVNAGYYFPVGNPNLEPERTTAYEMGITRRISGFAAIDVTAFYKDITNLIQVVSQPATPKSFEIYQNGDFATIKGLEVGLRMRRVHAVRFEAKYTLSSATGTGSFAGTQRNVAWTSANAPIQASALSYDQRHTLVGTFDVRDFGGNSSILKDFGVSTVFKFSSGTPYTPSVVYNENSLAAVSPEANAPVNSVYGATNMVIDLKADKTFKIFGAKLNAYVWVQNVLDTKNAIFVYESTGDPDNTGWLTTAPGQTFADATQNPDALFANQNGTELSNLRANDPTNFSNPRIILFGMNFFF